MERSIEVLDLVRIININIIRFSKIFMIDFPAKFFTPLFRCLVLSHSLKESISHCIRVNVLTYYFEGHISNAC